MPCGAEDMLELHNPTVEEVSGIRAALVSCIQEHCAAPYSDAHCKMRLCWIISRKEAIPPMRDLMWREYGMPADDRAYRAALARMTDEQVTSTAAGVYREHRH